MMMCMGMVLVVIFLIYCAIKLNKVDARSGLNSFYSW